VKFDVVTHDNEETIPLRPLNRWFVLLILLVVVLFSDCLKQGSTNRLS
jgi:hypothetical protein